MWELELHPAVVWKSVHVTFKLQGKGQSDAKTQVMKETGFSLLFEYIIGWEIQLIQ